MPDFEIVAEAADAHAVMEHVGRDAMDLLLLDLDMPGTTGMDLIQRVKACSPDLPILILSMHIEPGVAMRAIKAGASGYVTKDCDLNILLPAIRAVAAGRWVMVTTAGPQRRLRSSCAIVSSTTTAHPSRYSGVPERG